MMMRRFSTFLFSALMAWSVSAAPVDPGQAKSAAYNFLKGNFPRTKAADQELALVWSGGSSLKSTNNAEATYYVFNLSGQEGFIAVAGDDDVYPILAYGLGETFKVDSMPSSLRAWFEGYSRQITWVRDNKPAVPESVTNAWRQLREGHLRVTGDGVQLNTALWDQMDPYNGLTPSVNGQKTPTGCVATSTAIAMQYHKWPNVGQGSHSYTSSTYGFSLSATFNTPYAWNNMPMSYIQGQYTAVQAKNIAKLMFDCGVFSEMNYAPGNSGALTITAAQGLVNYMKYDKSLRVLQRNGYSTDEWESIVIGELDQDRPVVYGGENDKQEGHQFILDGYTGDGYFHVNWGWSGLANGYYRLAALEPEIQGTGGNSGGGFSINQDAMIGLKKPVAGSTYQDVLYFFSGESNGIEFNGLTTTATSIVPNTEFLVKAGFVGNFSVRHFNGNIALALVDAQGNIKQIISQQQHLSLAVEDGTAGEFPCMFTVSASPSDRVRMMYKSDDSNNWQWVRNSDSSKSEILVSNPTSNETIGSDAGISVISDPEGSAVITSTYPIQTISLYTVNGSLLKKQDTGDALNASFPYKEYPSGLYFIQVTTTDGKSTHKVVKK